MMHQFGLSWGVQPSMRQAIQNNCFACLSLLLSPQEVSAQSDEAAMPSDLAILAAAASQLFESSSDMSREAVVSLLAGLRDVSLHNIPANSGAVGHGPKLFALNRMVEVLLYNTRRIYDLWAIFLRCSQ